MPSPRIAVLLLLTGSLTPTCGRAGQFGERFEVLQVEPRRVIDHDVELKGPLDESRRQTLLSGPRYFAQSVADTTSEAPEPRAYLNWYTIKDGSRESGTLRIRDSLRGEQSYPVTIAEAAFLLSPAQRISSGPPSPLPEGLNYMIAYRVVDAPPADPPATSPGGPRASRVAGRPAYLCLPVEEWHHDEHFPVQDARTCLIVYETEPQAAESRISTIDQFGLNELTATSRAWSCVSAEVVMGTGTGSVQKSARDRQ
jgi:hypothetical protein